MAGRATAPTGKRLVARSANPQRHGARIPEHTLDPPVPVTARIVWEDDGEEHIETEAAGWSGQLVYVRVPDRRYRLTSVWLHAADVRRR